MVWTNCLLVKWEIDLFSSKEKGTSVSSGQTVFSGNWGLSRTVWGLILWHAVVLQGTPLSQEGGPLPGPKRGLLSNTQKWTLRGDTRADKAKDFTGKGYLGGEQQGKGAQENCSAMWLTVFGFMVMGLVSRLSLANRLAWPIFGLTQCPSWWRGHLSATVDSSEEDSGRLVGHMEWHLLSPFDLSWILVVGGSLLVPRSLPGPPVVRELMQVVTIRPGQGRRFRSVVSVTPLQLLSKYCSSRDADGGVQQRLITQHSKQPQRF